MTDHILNGFGENVEHFVGMIQINHDCTIDILACHINQSIARVHMWVWQVCHECLDR
jgi:hypothetical protein